MKLILDRQYPKATYTIGWLYVNGSRYCNTLEDTDRGLKQTDSLASIKKRKVYGETAIPKGKYKIRMDIVSPKYAAVAWYKALCGGKMPRVMDVPGFDGILVHPGSSALDTKGCVLVGKNTVKGGLTQSRDTFKKLYALMAAAAAKGEEIELLIR